MGFTLGGSLCCFTDKFITTDKNQTPKIGFPVITREVAKKTIFRKNLTPDFDFSFGRINFLIPGGLI